MLLITPPMTQLNTPYPATAYLLGFLRDRKVDAEQVDLSLELFLRLFSSSGLKKVSEFLLSIKLKNKSAHFFSTHADSYIDRVDHVIRFLQRKDPSLAHRIVSPDFLPTGPLARTILREASIMKDMGEENTEDQAKYLCSLFIDEVTEVIKSSVDPRFGLSRYAEKIAASQPTFDPLHEELENKKVTLLDELIDTLATETIMKAKPEWVLLTAPFPGNVYGAFRIARKIKQLRPETKTVFGGGYVNTELRELSDPKIFEYFNYLTLDDGERPVLSLMEGDPQRYVRTFVLEDGKVVYKNNPKVHDIPFKDSGCPSYAGLKLDQYVSLLEVLNPMHRLWSDGRWNKLTLAHGCYWKKCNFCDTSLDYIGRYEPASIDITISRIEKLIQETGETGFHFVDEAAPPALLKALALKLIEKNIVISWWGNIRFEKTFTPELCQLLAKSGCIAVSGGLEVASDRLLKLMQKGVTFEQVSRVTRAFSETGIMVHTYLMYGFPTQTEDETVDSLERVRQLFEQGCIHSAYWHRFSATAHSPIGKNPTQFGLKILNRKSTFAKNDLEFVDQVKCDHDSLGLGLKRATYNYMHGAGFDADVRFWFDKEIKPTTIPHNEVLGYLSKS